jgi:aryl-alcohol dehydrogenase-like predicted oxidoreductase
VILAQIPALNWLQKGSKFSSMVNLVLGTAQLGLDYGVTNSHGRPNDAEAASLLELAKNSNIATIDTAAAYGDAESRLGESGFSSKFDIISKFHSIPGENFLIEPHLKSLKLQSISGMLFHNASQIASETGQQNLNELRALQDEGLVSKIGFSAYQIDEIESALEHFSDPDIIQIPSHALDLRTLDSEILNEMASMGVEIHVRSVFMQGLLLAHPSSVSEGKYSFLIDTIKKVHEEAEKSNQSVMQFLFNQVRNHPNVSSIVIGANNRLELEQILSAWNSPIVRSERIQHNLDHGDLDPRNWK